MKILKIPFWLLWRLWFYVLIFFTILLLSPFLIVFTSKEKYYPYFWKTAKVWAKIVFYGMGFRLSIDKKQKLDLNRNYMICPNHTSILDIFILMIISEKPIVFVGKKELSKIPVFGYFYKRVSILVDRNSAKSRKEVYFSAKKRLQQGVNIAIYPEGLVPSEDVILAPFKSGAFSLAIEHQIPILPYVNYDCKRFFSWNIFKGRPGKIRVKQCNLIETNGLNFKDKESLKRKVYKLIHNTLKEDVQYMNDTNKHT